MLPGQSVTLYCHSEASRFRVQIARQGLTERVVFESPSLPGSERSMPDDLASDGCRWRPSFEIAVDAEWPSGMYLVRLTDDDGQTAEAFFVVCATEPVHAMLVLSTSTWSAYNDWGGPSFYIGGRVSSARRPLPRGFLHKAHPEQHRVAPKPRNTRFRLVGQPWPVRILTRRVA